MMDIKGLTIAKIEELLVQEDKPVDDGLLTAMKNDSRAGVKRLLEKYYRIQEEARRLRERSEAMLTEERRLWQQGYSLVGGVDEAGRGPLAGPVAAACVILPKDLIIEGVDDSKKLSPAKRDKLFDVIISEAVSYGIAFVGSERIDEVNIYQAVIEAMELAVSKCVNKPDYLLIDAIRLKDNPIPQLSIISGDAKSQSIAAASILAKVARDREMERFSEVYPGYGFEKHKGYGTKEHLEAIRELGLSPIHRRSFTISI